MTDRSRWLVACGYYDFDVITPPPHTIHDTIAFMAHFHVLCYIFCEQISIRFHNGWNTSLHMHIIDKNNNLQFFSVSLTSNLKITFVNCEQYELIAGILTLIFIYTALKLLLITDNFMYNFRNLGQFKITNASFSHNVYQHLSDLICMILRTGQRCWLSITNAHWMSVYLCCLS